MVDGVGWPLVRVLVATSRDFEWLLEFDCVPILDQYFVYVYLMPALSLSLSLSLSNSLTR
jgi:hypothetical protein